MKKYIFLEIPHTNSNPYHNILLTRYPNKSIFTLNKRENRTTSYFRSLDTSAKEKYRIIKGIHHFGLHTTFNNPASVQYITLLRDPIERVISLYNNIKKNKTHKLHSKIMTQKMSIKDFVGSSLSTELSNYQTSLLSGISFDLDTCNFDIYSEAKRNLKKHFVHVGIQEYFEDSLTDLQKLVSADSSMTNFNLAKSKTEKNTIPNTTLDLIHERNIYDIILYNKQLIKYRKLRKEV